MGLDPQQEYAAALADYRAAMRRIVEAKRHLPETARDRRNRELREERQREANTPISPELIQMIASGEKALLDYMTRQFTDNIERNLGASIKIVYPPA